MNVRHSRGLLTLFLTLGLATAWGCGGGGGYQPHIDALTDGGDDATGDVLTDGDDDAPADAPMDTPGDAPTDVDEDGGDPTRTYRPFLATTAGGDRASSTSYELELFIAPTMPVGSGTSANYNVKIGPAGIRGN
jgi:hypothetical protein